MLLTFMVYEFCALVLLVYGSKPRFLPIFYRHPNEGNVCRVYVRMCFFGTLYTPDGLYNI